MTFFQYRDVNLAYAYRPADVEPDVLRRKVMGALRYGKPFIIDYLSMELDMDEVAPPATHPHHAGRHRAPARRCAAAPPCGADARPLLRRWPSSSTL